VTIIACNRAAAVQRGLPAPDPVANAAARQRSNVATLIPTSRDTCSTEELSGGSSLATILSLYACPYRATSVFQRPQRFRSYPGGNFSDTGVAQRSDTRRKLLKVSKLIVHEVVRVSELLEIPTVVASTDLLGIFLSSMGPLMAKRLGLRVLPIPLELPPMPIYMIWHETRRYDTAHRWLREVVVAELMSLSK
jgi:DNA-binding transcriptional LysR family regulator